MTTPTQQDDCIRMRDTLKKEITGVQLMWEIIECLYFEPARQGLTTLEQDAPLVWRLMQTALVESLLMRMSRLMDPAFSGGGETKRNLSLKQLAEACKDTANDVKDIRSLWDRSKLEHIRDKYLSHNDLQRSQNAPHTLNAPLDETDVAAMRELTKGLREFRRKVQSRLQRDVSYLDEDVSLQVQREIDVLNRTLLGGKLFFELLPEHTVVQQAWHKANHE